MRLKIVSMFGGLWAWDGSYLRISYYTVVESGQKRWIAPKKLGEPSNN